MYRQVKGPSGFVSCLGGPSLAGLSAIVDPHDTILTLSRCLAEAIESGHDGPMEREHAETTIRRRGLQGALAGKRAADSRANALASIIHELMAAGFLSRLTLTAELNRRGIPTAQSARWHDNTVVRMLSRLGLRASLIDGRINNGQAGKQSAESKAGALASTVRKLQAQGFATHGAIARELNAREIPTSQGSKWISTSVRRLLHHLERLKL
jgi:hypothetical protein